LRDSRAAGRIGRRASAHYVKRQVFFANGFWAERASSAVSDARHSACFSRSTTAMKRRTNRIFLAGTQLAFAVISLLGVGCGRTVQLDPTAEDRRIAKQAIAPGEVLLMLRGGYKENSAITEVTRRRVSEVVDSITENKLLDAGATPALLAAMKKKENVLTAAQKVAYDEDQAARTEQVQQDTANRMRVAASQEADRQQEIQRRQYYQQQTMANIRGREQQQAGYEQADKNYREQKAYLERNAQYLEANINRRRGRGCTEADLAADNRTLDKYREQLRDLTPPLRPF
jgi:hypothetical protein